MSWKVLLIPAFLILAAGAWLLGPVAPAEREPVPSHDQELRREVRDLTRQVDQLKARSLLNGISHPPAAQNDGESQEGTQHDNDDVVASDPADETTEERTARIRLRESRNRRTLSERVGGEPSDRAWSRETEVAIQQSLADLKANEFPGTQVVKLECKSTLCSVQLEHASRDEALRLQEALKIEGIPNMRGYIDTDETTGAYSTHLFMASAKGDLRVAED